MLGKSVQLPVSKAPQFAELLGKLKASAAEKGYGDQIYVQGSRAAGTATPESDLDIAIRVTPHKFQEILKQAFNGAKPPSKDLPNGNAVWRAMQEASEQGRIFRGEIGMHGLGVEMEKGLGIKQVQITIIRAGGAFENGPFVPVD